MDKNKKKKARRKAKATANTGEHSALDHSDEPHCSSEKSSAPVAVSPSLLDSLSWETELRKEEKDESASAAPPVDTEDSLQIFDRHRVDGRLDDATDVDTRDSGGENLREDYADSCTNEEKVERVQMQALIIQMTQMQALAQEKEHVVRELEELQEALAIERETAELLREQMTYLQGHISERDVLEMGTQKQVQRLNSENVYLQGLASDLTEKVKKLEEELGRAEEERGKLADENRQIVTRKEKEEGKRVAELIKKVEKLEQEREDLEEKQNKLKQEGKKMIVRMEQEGEKMEQLSRQMISKMETERQKLEQEIRQMSVKMEQEQEKLEKERLRMKATLEQERLKFDEENKQKVACLTAEGEKLERENRQLLLKLEQERDVFYEERNQMKATIGLERETLEQERLQMAERLAQERKQMELEYEQKKSKLELEQETLEHNSRQITSKLTALDSQLEQLEREASVRERVFRDLATVTEVDSSKSWESWRVYGKDPLAEAIAVAEEARMQRMAMAQTVDKLLAENVELMEKVNEQAIMINDLSKRISSDVKGAEETSYAKGSVGDGHEVIWRPDMETETTDSMQTSTRVLETKSSDFEHYGGHMNGYAMHDISGYIVDKSIDQNVDTSIGRHSEEPSAVKSSRLDLDQEASAAIAGRIPFEESGSSESFTTLYEITEIRDDSSGPAEVVKSPVESSAPPNRGSAKASSLIKAPARFLSFVAGYISGADLVKN